MAVLTVTLRTTPPAAEVLVTALPTGTAYVRLWRVWGGREVRLRGDERADVIGGTCRHDDYDLPVGRPVTYRVRAYGVSGQELATPQTVPAPVTVTLPDPSLCWLSDPLAPALSVLLKLEGSSDTARSYDAETATPIVIGHRDPTAISGARLTAGGWSFTFRSLSHETSDQVEGVLRGGGTVLLRPVPGAVRHDTGLIYLSVPSAAEGPRHDLYWPGRASWTLAGRQVRPPSAGVVMPFRTWQDVLDEAATWQQLMDMHPDWLSVVRG